MLAGQQGWPRGAPAAGEGTRSWCPTRQLAGVLVCIDIKRENWTSRGFRARSGQACYLFDPSLRTAVPPAGSLLYDLAGSSAASE